MTFRIFRHQLTTTKVKNKAKSTHEGTHLILKRFKVHFAT